MYPLFLEFYKYLHQIQKIYKNSQIFQKKSLCILIIKPKLTLPNLTKTTVRNVGQTSVISI